MTYCVGMLVEEGLAMIADTRTNAGLDNISTYRKMFHFEVPGERVITITTAGSLSVTQTTIARLREAADDPEATEETSILKAPTMLKVASIIGATLCAVRLEIDEKLATMKQGASATMLILRLPMYRQRSKPAWRRASPPSTMPTFMATTAAKNCLAKPSRPAPA